VGSSSYRACAVARARGERQEDASLCRSPTENDKEDRLSRAIGTGGDCGRSETAGHGDVGIRRQADAWAPTDQRGGKSLAIGSTESLGWTYVFMALAALAVISIDQTLVRTLTSMARIALDGALGAGVGLALLELLGFPRRWQ
jgi:hypothetical protein